jgi:hypothetical protein
MIEQMKMIVPAFLIKANDLSKTSLKTYFGDGILYSGSSVMKAELLPLKKNFFIINAEISITIIERK